MSADGSRYLDSRSIRERQQSVQRDEFRAAVRGLLMTPLMSPACEAFAAVHYHGDFDWPGLRIANHMIREH
jgi:hypothetical protein